MIKKASLHWAAPLGAMFSFVPPFCSYWPDNPGGGHGHAGSAHAGSGAEAGTATGGAGGEASESLPVIGCPAGPWPETAELHLLEGYGDISAGLISGDGEVSVGRTELGPIFWSEDDVVQVELAYASTPRAVTCDGSLVVGNISDTIVAFRALRSGSFSYLQTPAEWGAWTTEDDVSEGGIGLGNHRYPQPLQPVTWDESGALTELTALRGLDARRISPDGRTIWGVTRDCDTGCTTDAIFRYSAAEGITRYPIGAVPGAVTMANDGSALFELAEEGGVPLPFDVVRPLYRFDSSTGTITSIACPAARRCWPVAVSSHAAVAFFNSSRPPGEVFTDSWVWDEAHGSRSIPTLLADLGLSVAGDLAPGGVSDDARVFTGSIFRGEGVEFVPFRILVPRGTFY
jgi:hypothetical protein